MTKQKEKVSIFIRMVLHTQANGKTTNSMDTVKKNGQMELSTKEALSMA